MAPLIILPEGMIDLFRLYTFIDKLNLPIANVIQTKMQRGGDVCTLSMTANTTTFIVRKNDDYFLAISGVVGTRVVNITVKLGNINYPVNKRVVNEVKSKLFKHFNGFTPSLYTDSLWNAIERNLTLKFKKFEKEFKRCLFSKTLKDTINLQTTYNVALTLHCTNMKKYKIIPSGIAITVEFIVFNMPIAKTSFSLHGCKTDLHDAFNRQMDHIKSIVI